MRALLAGGVSLGVLLAACPAHAKAVDVNALMELICKQPTEHSHELRARLATGLLVHLGIFEGDSLTWLRSAVAGMPNPTAEQTAAQDAILDIEQMLGPKSNRGADERGLHATPPPAPGQLERGWILSDDASLVCVNKTSRSAGGGLALPAKLRLRQTSEALSAVNDERLKAPSALFGYRRDRTVDAAAAAKVTTTVSFKGVLGWAFDERDEHSLFLFGGYELNRARSNPPAALAPGARRKDGDTEVVELGLSGHNLFGIESALPVFVTASGSALFDRVKESSRVRVKVSAYPGLDIGRSELCGFGEWGKTVDLGFLRYRARCRIGGLVQLNQFLDKGLATPGTKDDLVLAGGAVSYEIAPVGENGIVAGASYQYQETLSGTAPSIDRFSTYLKYRYWIDRKAGIDFGFTFNDGINPDSFVDENRLEFSIGLVF